MGLASDDVHEVAQEAFLRIYERFDAYRGEAEWGYLQVTVRRVLFNWIRSKQASRRHVRFVPIEDSDNDALMLDETPEAQMLAQEAENAAETQIQRLRTAIAALPSAAGSCLLLALAGYNYADIAKQLRITPEAVKSRLHDARRKLRSTLRNETHCCNQGTGLLTTADADDQPIATESSVTAKVVQLPDSSAVRSKDTASCRNAA